MTEAAALEIANQSIEIATLPEVTMRIVEVVQDPRSTASDLHKIVRNDPALSARVLRVVNSAFYGLPGQIGSIDRAIMLLGLNAVKNIAIAASIGKMFKSSVICDDFSGKDLWTHSVAVGATNKLITSSIGLALPDEAFLAGLIHDIGLVAVMQCHGQKIPEIIDLAKGGVSFVKAEEKVLGADHQEIGSALTAKWKFPRSFQYVTGYHHNPTNLAQENRLLSVVTYVSDVMCAQRDIGISIVVETDIDEAQFDKLIAEIGISQEQLNQIGDHIEKELEIVRALIE
ncbi:MAG: HDOD domain-containing protein [Sedimentisphaerales bacterium]|nr:HDOD domain-containing protein [Sedimentisphaerales bacterium]